jgi:quinol monooxygenase YgiN
MKNIICFNTQTRKSVLRCLLYLPGLMMFQFSGCKPVWQETGKAKEITVASAIEKSRTFQELGFFGEIKKDKWGGFLIAVQNNIKHSRKELGNLSFSLYQPEDGKLQPIWFERFKSKAAHNEHKKRHYFKDAIKVIQGALKGEVESVTLNEVKQIPAAIPVIADRQERTVHLVVLYQVSPEKKRFFISAMAKAALHARKAQGNLEYNLYEYADDPNRFALIEGWQNRAYHTAQLNQDYIRQLGNALNGFLITGPFDARWTLNDISQ